MQLLEHAGLRQIFSNGRAGGSGITLQLGDRNEIRRKRRERGSGKRFPPVPSEEGKKLMDGGVFGSNEYYRDMTRKRNTRLAGKLMDRELGPDRGQSTRSASAISQVMRGCASSVNPSQSLLTLKGNDTILERGYNNSLQCAMLFWSIFRGRELLLLLRSGLQSAIV